MKHCLRPALYELSMIYTTILASAFVLIIYLTKQTVFIVLMHQLPNVEQSILCVHTMLMLT